MSTKKQILNVFRSKKVRKVFSMKIGNSIIFLLVSDMAKKRKKKRKYACHYNVDSIFLVQYFQFH